jgi:two-component system, NarL family, nitrate/nitrite response regulator NarL
MAHPVPRIRTMTTLSRRESLILHCLVLGASNRQISRDLRISEAAVKVHLTRLLVKLKVVSRSQAQEQAIDDGWVVLNSYHLAKIT